MTVTTKGIFFVLMLLLPPALAAEPAEVQVPVSLEYRLLEQFLELQYFNQPGGAAELLEGNSCNRITLTEPRLQPSGEVLQIDARVRAQLGMATPGGCSSLIDWAGAVSLLGLPVVDPGGTSIRFETREAWLIGRDGNKINEGALWQMARPRLQAFFNDFTLDLQPQIESVASLLPEVLPHHSASQLQTIVNSLALDSIQVTPQGLTVEIAMEIEKLAVDTRPERALGTEELQQFEERWQAMDALLVWAVKTYAADTGLEELRNALLDALIDSRYRLRDALAVSTDSPDDPVREWFLDSWQALAPVVRQIALAQAGQEHLLWLTLFTATDALRVLDQLGPGIGLDISVDGVRRLARLINENQVEAMLRYSDEVDPVLQKLYRQRFRPAPPRAAFRFNFSLIAKAHAASGKDRLNRWAPGRDELAEYLPIVGRLLQDQTRDALKDRGLEPEIERLAQRLVLAAAWQESCWRQYMVKNKRLEPLRSGSGDVGLMQVNEKIWRGIYDQHQLRWDIDYNSQAGIEVLLDYLQKYALKKEEHKRSGGLDNLARASYSAYNGGPSQVSRYRRSNVPAAHRKIDAAFWDKYQQVAAGNELGVAKCLGGKPLPRSLLANPAPAVPAADSGMTWVQSQPKAHFTLQLGAFSQRDSAAKFIRQESLPGPVSIYPAPAAGGATNYVVLQGSYANRGDADRAKTRFARFKPWVRSFESLTQAK